LDAKINEGESTVEDLNDKIDDSKVSLEDAIRTESMLSSQNSLLYLFGSRSLSAIFDNISKYKEVQDALNTQVVEIKEDKAKLEETIEALEDSKAEQGAVVQTTLLAKKMVESNKTEKKTLLAETKGQEAIYTANLKNKEKEIAKVRAALFELSGSKSINFGSAYDLAIQMEKLTGVRAAYLMALVTVESNLGKNVGTGNWKTDMHPTRDQPLFKTICEELGLNPDEQKVSKKAWYGYGGAMGPAQFIPSTWVSYKDKVSAVTGNTPANPWNTRDAFAAAALLLKDNGATSGKSNAEHRAAVCYLAGCGNASKAAYQFYGNDVMSIAAKYETQIKLLNGN
jgi:outer membrane murein-binding lipoprotein Lpp